MIPQGRPLFALVTVVVLLVFFFAGPFSAKPAPVRRISNADARLARWIEVVSPPGKPFRPVHAYASPLRQPIRDQSKPLVPINLYPLGKPEANADEYLNARKRAKATFMDSYGQKEISNALQSQTPNEVNSPTASEDSLTNSPGADDTSVTKKKGSSVGLSPLDRLPSADTPVAQKDHAGNGFSPLGKFPPTDESSSAKPAVVHKAHAVAGLSPLDRLPPANPPVMDADLPDSTLHDQEPHTEHTAGAPKAKSDIVLKNSVEATTIGGTLPQANSETAPLVAEVGDSKSPTIPGTVDGRTTATSDRPVAAKAGVADKLPNFAAKLSSPVVAAQAPALKGHAGTNPALGTKAAAPASLAEQSNLGEGAKSKLASSGEAASTPLDLKKLVSAGGTGSQAVPVKNQNHVSQTGPTSGEPFDVPADSIPVAQRAGLVDNGVQAAPKPNHPIA